MKDSLAPLAGGWYCASVRLATGQLKFEGLAVDDASRRLATTARPPTLFGESELKTDSQTAQASPFRRRPAFERGAK
jgi:hypothetical protein